ncbi:MAG: MerC domain-containing protein [Planctomycetota bacterium]
MTTALTMVDSDPAGGAGVAAHLEQAPPGAWSDWVGMAASIGCAIHCAAMPFVIAYLPALGLSFLADEAFHKWMAVGCFIVALTAFIPGVRKHRRLSPVIIASVGLVMITVAAFGFAGECCPSCERASIEIDGAPVALDSPATCTDADCSVCVSETGESPPVSGSVSPASLTASLTTASPLMASIVPWLTPLGGMVLVSAHLLNHRYGCRCGSCRRESSDEAVG